MLLPRISLAWMNAGVAGEPDGSTNIFEGISCFLRMSRDS